jgi:hypothetical protein
MRRRLSVFLCSTFSDLAEERDRILDAVRRLQLQHDAMEFFGARADRPIDTCLAEVRRSDALVVVVGHRYGNLVPELDISFSEAEYREGQRLDKPCLVYMRDENAPVLLKHVERDPHKLRLLENWKEALATRHTIARFADAHDLAVQVAADLSRTVQALEAGRSQLAAALPSRDADLAEVESLVAEAIEKGIPSRLIASSIRRALATLELGAGDRRPLVFLSHAHADRALVRPVAAGLRQHGIDVWIGEAEPSISDPSVTQIERGLDAADLVGFFLSRASVQSEGMRQELNVAISRQLSGSRGATLLPIVVEDVEIPALLRDATYLDMRGGDVTDGVRRLAAAVRRQRLERLRNVDQRFYGDVGIEIPSDVATWDDARLFDYIEQVLQPEARTRAHRDYENVSVNDPMSAIRVEAEHKIEEVARRYGFLAAWHRYRAAGNKAT